MILFQNIFIAINQIRSNKLRSILTTLGITLGIATVILIVSILEGYKASIYEDLSMLGANTFQVQKWDQFQGFQVGNGRDRFRPNLKRELADVIRQNCPAVKTAAAEDWRFGQIIRYRDNKTNPNVSVAGGEDGFFVNNGYFVSAGRQINENDIRSGRKVVVLGMDVVDAIFPYEDPLDKIVKIGGQKFMVIGILDRIGNRTFGGSQDNVAVIPLSTWQDIWGKESSVNITVMAQSPELFETAQDQVIGILRKERKVAPGEDNDFALFSNDTLMNTFNDIGNKVQLGSVALGLISLIVGSIGVMNIMLVSVTERTREIGIRKAIGAKKFTIMIQFLFEAVFLSLIGGILGLGIGFGLSAAIGMALKIPFTLPLWAVIISLVMTSLVGIAAGMYPAAKAANLDPIEALRYE